MAVDSHCGPSMPGSRNRPADSVRCARRPHAGHAWLRSRRPARQARKELANGHSLKMTSAPATAAPSQRASAAQGPFGRFRAWQSFPAARGTPCLEAHALAPVLDNRRAANGSRARTDAIVHAGHPGIPALHTDVYQNSCTLKRVCYNAETTSNKLSRKGLSVIRNRFVHCRLRLICFAASPRWRSCRRPSTQPARRAVDLDEKSDHHQRKLRRQSTTTRAKHLAKKTDQETSARSDEHSRARRAKAGSRQGGGSGQGAGGSTGTASSRPTRTAREVPDVRAEAAIIYNPETGAIL